MVLTSKESKTSQAIVEMYNLGYRNTVCGKLISPYRKNLVIGMAYSGRANYVYVKTPKSLKHLVDVVPLHRFVGYCKYGDDIFTPELVLRHVNSDKNDNSTTNIVLGTYAENTNDIPKHVRIRSATIASHSVPRISRVLAARRYSNLTVEKVRELHSHGMKQADISRLLNIPGSTVSRIVRNENYCVPGVDY